MKISILEEDTPGTSKEEFVSLEEDTLGTSNEEFAILVLRKVPLGTSNEEFAILQEVNLLALWSPLPIGTNLIKHMFPTPVLNPLWHHREITTGLAKPGPTAPRREETQSDRRVEAGSQMLDEGTFPQIIFWVEYK